MTEMKRIDDYVKSLGKVPDYLYHTKRELDGGKGRIRILVMKDDGVARTEYVCPYCQEYGYQENDWKRPYSFKCDSCGKTVKVAKLKDQVKREQKKASKEEE